MVKMWCISCKVEREHSGNYEESCLVNCQHACNVCRKAALTSIAPSQSDTGHSLIKQMVGEAQRKAVRTGQSGDIEVSRTVIKPNNEYYCQILVYNTNTGNYRSN